MRLLISYLCVVLLVLSANGEKNPKCEDWGKKFDLCLKRGFQPKIFTHCKPLEVEKRQDYCIRFERYLRSPRNQCNYQCGFTPVQRSIKADFNKDMSLEVRTNSIHGSQDRMYMYFQDENEEWAGAFLVLFGRTPSYQIGWCYQTWEALPDNLPEDQEKVWKITRTGKGLKVSCNGEELLDVELREEICDRMNLKKPWAVYWSRDISQFYFPTGDTASISFMTREISDMDSDKTDDNNNDMDDGDMDKDTKMEDNKMEDEDKDEEGDSSEMDIVLCSAKDRMIPCPKNPCDSMSCPRYPNAECLPNLCGCSAMFRHEDGTVVDTCEEPECDENMPSVTCQGNPCEEATCPSHPDAYCSVTFCGDCAAIFRDDEGNEVPDCAGDDMDDEEKEGDKTTIEPTTCDSCTDVYAMMPGGGESLMPSFDAETKGCSEAEKLECMDGFTCGTHTITYSMDLLRMKVVSMGCVLPQLTCELLVSMSAQDMSGNMKFEDCEIEITKPIEETQGMCPEGVVPVACYLNPCDSAACPAHPNAVCIANYCGSCNAVFYDVDGNHLQDCHGEDMV